MGRLNTAVVALGVAASVVGARGPVQTRSAPDPASHASIQQQAPGAQLFTSKGNCFACHGPAAKGTALGPNLTDAEFLNGSGTIEDITRVIREGVTTPKKSPTPMPAMGGAQLNDAEINALAQYVFSLRPTPPPAP